MYKEIGIDYLTDCSGDGGHLNDYGVTKFTKYVGDYIYNNYSLIDHRGDDRYSPYENGVEWLNEIRRNE